MLRTRLLSAPPAIAIDDEPLGADRSDWVPICVEGFELVLAWQARPARARRRVLATVPVLAVAAAVALSFGPGHGATPMRAGASNRRCQDGPRSSYRRRLRRRPTSRV